MKRAISWIKRSPEVPPPLEPNVLSSEHCQSSEWCRDQTVENTMATAMHGERGTSSSLSADLGQCYGREMAHDSL